MRKKGIRSTNKEKAAQFKRMAKFFVDGVRNAETIGKRISQSSRTVQRMANHPQFHAELDALGYTGPRNFSVNEGRHHPKRDAAREMWETPEIQKLKPTEQIHRISEAHSISHFTVRDWIQKWKKEAM